MIGRCPRCGEVLYDNGRFYGCTHHDRHDMEERAAIKEFDGGMTKEQAEGETLGELCKD